jgi:acyl transferase domain-containing protein
MLIADPEVLPNSFITGNGSAMFSNRISHFYDLKGTSVTSDTGCSGGMIALHHACRNLQFGESEMSIVAASSLILNPDMFIAMSNLGYEFSCPLTLSSCDHIGSIHTN